MMNIIFDLSMTKDAAKSKLQKLSKTKKLTITISCAPVRIVQEENLLAYIIKETQARHLIMSRCRGSFVRDDHLKYLKNALDASPNIHSLTLSNNYIASASSFAAVDKIFLALDGSYIEYLDMSDNFLLSTLTHVRKFLHAIKNSKITHVNLSNNRFNYLKKHSKDDYLKLTAALNATNITNLNLSSNNLGDVPFEQWKYFCQMLVSSNLTSLDLSCNNLSRLESWQWAYLGDAIDASKIRKLNLSANDLGHMIDSQVIGFSIFLEKLSLLSLDLSSNDLYLLTSYCWTRLGAAIRNIFNLDLSNNNLGLMIELKWQTFNKVIKTVQVVELNLSSNDLFRLSSSLQVQLLDLLSHGKMMQVNLNSNAIAQSKSKFNNEVFALFSGANNRSLQQYYSYNLATIARLCANLGCVVPSKRTSSQSINYNIDEFIGFFLNILFYKKFNADIVDYHILPYLTLDDKLLTIPISSSTKLMLAMSILYENNPVLHHLHFTDPEKLFENKAVVARYIQDENLSLTVKYCDNYTDLNSLLTKQNVPILHQIVQYNYGLNHIWELLVRGADPFKEYLDKDYKQVSALSVAIGNKYDNIIKFFYSFREFLHQISAVSQDTTPSLRQNIYTFLDNNGIGCFEQNLEIYETLLKKHYPEEKATTVDKFRNMVLQSRNDKEEELAM